jgi:hypothetical protein
MPRLKRPRASQDLPSPTKKLRPRLSHQVPDLPPTPDDVLSTANSHFSPNGPPDPANPDAAPDDDKGIPTPDDVRSITNSLHSPAIPGVVRSREQGVLSKLPPTSDVVDFFTNLINDSDLSPEEALVKFITTYEVPIDTVNRIASNSTLLLHHYVPSTVIYC